MNDHQLDSRISATNGHTFENLCIGDVVLEMFAWLKQSGTMETTTKIKGILATPPHKATPPRNKALLRVY